VATSTVPSELVTPRPRFLDAKQVGARLGCSWRHVLRMADRGLMPWGVKLGALRRWDPEEIELWIKDGCRAVRQAGRA
jgi:predicted DNA-binding transcriptional regulator AlpA